MEKIFKIISNWFLKHGVTVAACVLISILGFVFVVFSSPGTTLVGNNIDTDGDVSASSTITAGELLTVVPYSNYTPVEVGYILDDESPEGVGSAHAIENLKGGIYVSGNYAYITSWSDSALSIFDISDPTNPTETGYIKHGVGASNLISPTTVKVVGKYAYVIAWGSDALSVFDISDPTNPVETSFLKDGVGAECIDGPFALDVLGRYAYIAADSEDSLAIIDISDPTNLKEVGCILDDSKGGVATALNATSKIFISGKYAYITSMADDALSIFDISDPTNPYEVGYIQDNNQGGTANCLDLPHGLYVSGRYAYTGTRFDHGLSIIDVYDPTNPIEVGCIQDSSQTGGTANAMISTNGVYVSGKYAYVASGAYSWDVYTDDSDALSIIDISDPANPIQVGYIQDDAEGGTATALAGAFEVFVSGKYAYVVSYEDDSLSIIQLPSAELPTANVGNIVASSINVLGNVTVGNNLYIQTGLNVGSGGMTVVGDVGVFASSTLTSTSSQPGLSITQNGTGNLVEFKDAGTTIFYIADGGNATTTGNLNISGTLNIGEGTPIVKHLSTTAAVDFPVIVANGCYAETISLSGAEEGNVVSLGSSDNFGSLSDVTWTAWVSSAGNVSIKACNASTSDSSDLSAETIRISVWKY